MKTKLLTTMAVTGLMVAGLTTAAWAASPKMKMTTDIPKAFTAPDKVETSIGTLKYFDGVPTKESTKAIYDYLDTSRAVNVYLNSIPALSVNALREGQAAVGADTSNKIVIWDSLMDSNDGSADRQHLHHVCCRLSGPTQGRSDRYRPTTRNARHS